MQVTNLYV